MKQGADAGSKKIVMAEVGAPHGIVGWVRLRSYADPAEAIERYTHFEASDGTRSRQLSIQQYSSSGRYLIAKIDGIDTRTQAEQIRGLRLKVATDELASLPDGDYYWHELVGLQVVNIQGSPLGRVERLLETGANDVLVVVKEGEQTLIPWGLAVQKVDMRAGVIRVDWQRDF